MSDGSQPGRRRSFGLGLQLDGLVAPSSSASRYAVMPVAMKLSMIVEMTSLTPRVTFSTPAMPAHAAAHDHGHQRMNSDVERRREVDGRAGRRAEQRGQAVLAVDADVEQVHLEAERHGEPDDVERHGRG